MSYSNRRREAQTLNLLGHRFWIDKGMITFSGAKPPIPELKGKY